MTAILFISGLLSQMIILAFSQPMVTVEQGKLLGKTVNFEHDFLGIDKDIDVFLSVPFAEPPVGENRFKAPLPKEPWADDEVYNATHFRDICMQFGPELGSESYFTQSENCLYLNVYAPSPMPSGAPVMVYIHGGSWLYDNGYQGYYGGVPLAAVGDVIIVTMNYRLSAFGFLTTGDEASPGNYGMLDQVEALRWVKTNIEAFGGDPNKITLFGESVGAVSVSAHLFSPLSRDLFEQAIMESGSFLLTWAVYYDLEAEREKAFKIGAEVGCVTSDTEELMSCMREVTATDLNSAATQLGFVAAPAVDGNFIKELPMVSLENGNFKKCPLIHGFNKDEGTNAIYYSDVDIPINPNSTEAPFMSKDIFEEELNWLLDLYPFYTSDLIKDSIKHEYIDWSKEDDPDADYFDTWAYIVGDLWYSCPAILETRAHALADVHDIYLYFFTHAPSANWGPSWLEAGHGEELHFVFGYPFDPLGPFTGYNEYTEEEMELSLHVMKYWTNFARTGNPSKESSTLEPYSDDRAWPAFTIPELQYKELAVNLNSGRGLKADECHFWNDYLQQLTTFSADLKEADRQWKEEFYTWKYTDMEHWRDAFDKYQAATNKKSSED